MEKSHLSSSNWHNRLESIREYVNSLVVKRRDFSELLKRELLETLSKCSVIGIYYLSK